MSQRFIKPNLSILTAGDKDALSMNQNNNHFVDILLGCEPFTSEIIHIDSGACTTLIITKQGHIYGRGLNNHGQLALGDNDPRNVWVRIPFPFKVKQIACKSRHSLFLTEQGQVYSSGSNNWGEMVFIINQL